MDTIQLLTAINSDNAMRTTNIGVFAADRLPTNIKRYPFWFISNNQPANKNGEHWLLFYGASPSTLEYFDSLGRAIPAIFTRFVCNFQNILRNEFAVQSQFTAHCGAHCLYVAWHRCRGRTMCDILRTYSRTDRQLNDSRVKEFVDETLLRRRSTVFSPSTADYSGPLQTCVCCGP